MTSPYEGLPAAENMSDPNGRHIVNLGEVREGGSHHERMWNIVMWNTLMDEQNYLIR